MIRETGAEVALPDSREPVTVPGLLRMKFSPFCSWICAGWMTVATLAANPESTPPPDAKLVEKKFEELSSVKLSPLGEKVLAINPRKWRHAESDNFVYHFRRVTEAQRVVREVEYTLWYVAKTLNAGRDRYSKKSHIFIFQDEKEWRQFLIGNGFPEWSASFAHGDDLYLSVARAGGQFDSDTLAHEATHAVVARLYPGRRWPLWLNEGFAEYMGTATQAFRTRRYLKGMQSKLEKADMKLDELFAMQKYPEDREKVTSLYQTSERVVRFLMTEFPKERFPQFVELVLEGKPFDDAVLAVYGDKVTSANELHKKYNHFRD
mgnify:FL=1